MILRTPSKPSAYLMHAHMVHRPETWQAVCSTEQSSTVDTFANHLDTVETHLLQEIAARSAHFFEAAGVVQDLRCVLTRTFHQVSSLRKEVRQPSIVNDP